MGSPLHGLVPGIPICLKDPGLTGSCEEHGRGVELFKGRRELPPGLVLGISGFGQLGGELRDPVSSHLLHGNSDGANVPYLILYIPVAECGRVPFYPHLAQKVGVLKSGEDSLCSRPGEYVSPAGETPRSTSGSVD